MAKKVDIECYWEFLHLNICDTQETNQDRKYSKEIPLPSIKNLTGNWGS